MADEILHAFTSFGELDFLPDALCGIYLLRGIATSERKLRVMYYIGESESMLGRLHYHRGAGNHHERLWFKEPARMVVLRLMPKSTHKERLDVENRFLHAAQDLELPLLNGKWIKLRPKNSLAIETEQLNLAIKKFGHKRVCYWLTPSEVHLIDQFRKRS